MHAWLLVIAHVLHASVVVASYTLHNIIHISALTKSSDMLNKNSLAVKKVRLVAK